MIKSYQCLTFSEHLVLFLVHHYFLFRDSFNSVIFAALSFLSEKYFPVWALPNKANNLKIFYTYSWFRFCAHISSGIEIPCGFFFFLSSKFYIFWSPDRDALIVIWADWILLKHSLVSNHFVAFLKAQLPINKQLHVLLIWHLHRYFLSDLIDRCKQLAVTIEGGLASW